jgi:hypothetical protein
VRDARVVEYELMIVREQASGLAYEAHPSGQAVATFVSRTLTDSAVVFETPAHDFPQRIGYEHQGPSAVLAWIEGARNGQTRRVEYPYRRVSCPAGS